MTTFQNRDNTVLVVDDNPDNLRLLAGILRKNHYKIRLAPSGERALATIRKKAPDLVLLDIMMPDMDGFEVCRQLKVDQRTSRIPVIFISALDAILDKVKAFSIGGVDYITKPFKSEEVLVRVNTHLTLRCLQRNLEKKNAQLRSALDEIRILRGILPICSSCKKIRNEDGHWEQIETYIRDRSRVDFTHGICEECARKLYSDFM
jgi:DNA-binding response OmpR family regulator